MDETALTHRDLPAFDRHFFESDEAQSCVGTGFLGGKASGLVRVRATLEEVRSEASFAQITLRVPRFAVIATDVFERFLEENRLWELALSDASNEHIANAFLKAALPVEIVGDLRALVMGLHVPLAIRSSSRLEDALHHPLAGVYATKMIPNKDVSTDARFRALTEAIKLVWASTFFTEAKAYMAGIGESLEHERMAVLLQEIIGRRRDERFYPVVSGVARSWNFYPLGAARPEEGVVHLALGLGRTIVDGGASWRYSPAQPWARPPFGSTSEQLEQTQLDFWAVNMGPAPSYDPVLETEYLVQGDLSDAEADGCLGRVASTYVAESDRIVMGVSRPGPRVLDFAPLLQLDSTGFAPLVRVLLEACATSTGRPIEMEFAFEPESAEGTPAEFGFLQVRPLLVSEELVELEESALQGNDVLVASNRVLGNGVVDDLRDVVYMEPTAFDSAETLDIARELGEINERLVADGRHALFIGFGRWGSSDPWLGVPVTWGHIASARAIVEATLPDMNVDPSQGSHFFHNITSFAVPYFTVHHNDAAGIDWDWLAGQPTHQTTAHLRHIRLDRPLRVEVDGRCGRGVILRNAAVELVP